MKNKKFVATAVSAALVASVVAPVVADAATGKATTKTNIVDVKLYGPTKAKVYYKSTSGKTTYKNVDLSANPVKHLSSYALIPWGGKTVKWQFTDRVQLPQQKSFAKYLAQGQAAVKNGDGTTAADALKTAKAHFNNMSVLHYSANTLKSYKEKLAALEADVAAMAVTVMAINNTTVEVTMGAAVTDVKALNFTIDGLDIKNAAVKQTDAKTVVLTTSAQEGGKAYTVKESNVILGSFKGIAAVIPTSIVLDTKSTQGVVGNEVTVKATVTVPEGQSKAGIPVTFSVDASNNNLNKDLVAEVLTDANGVATYTYSQYAAYEDVVVAYATGNAALRETGKVYWGVQPILTVKSSTTGDAANGTVKTYTATYLNPLTGKAVSNAKVYVNFQENMDTPVTNDTGAKATNPATGQGFTPTQTATTEKPLELTTNSKGEVVFTVSGANTTATPVVWVDGSGQATTADKRFEATELQAVAEAAKFVGAQYTFKFNKTETFDVPVNTNTVANGTTAPAKYFEYEVEVLQADGKPYAGGTAVVDIYENIDDSLATTSAAKIYADGTDVQTIPNVSGLKLKLDKNGKAKFKVYSNTENTVATPVVWVDVNDATNATGKLEKEESNARAGSAVFRAETLASAKLKDLTVAENKGAGAYDLAGTEQPVYQIELLDQAGNAFTGTTNGITNATYVLTNTGSSEMVVNLTPGANYTIEQVNGSTAVATTQTIAAGQSVTVYGKVTGNPLKVDLGVKVTTSKSGDLKVSGSVSTAKTGTTITGTNIYDANGNVIGTINNGTVVTTAANYFAAGEVSTKFVATTPFDATKGYNGTVVGYYTKPATAGGKVVVKLDGRDEYVTIPYTTATPLLTGSSLSNLSATNEKGFETALSINDTIAYNTPQVNTVGTAGVKLGLGNVDNSSNDKQYGTVGTTDTVLPVITLTATTAEVNVGDTVDLKTYIKEVTDNVDGVISNDTVTINPTTVDTTQAGTTTVTYTVKDSSGNVGTATLTVTVKAPLGADELAGTITPVFGAQRIVVTLPAGTTAVDSVTVNDVEITDTKNVTNDQLIIADREPLIQKTDVVKVTIGGKVYTVKF